MYHSFGSGLTPQRQENPLTLCDDHRAIFVTASGQIPDGRPQASGLMASGQPVRPGGRLPRASAGLAGREPGARQTLRDGAAGGHPAAGAAASHA